MKKTMDLTDLEKDRFENSKALLKLCEALHARRVHLKEYIDIFRGITRTVKHYCKDGYRTEQKKRGNGGKGHI